MKKVLFYEKPELVSYLSIVKGFDLPDPFTDEVGFGILSNGNYAGHSGEDLPPDPDEDIEM